MIRRIAIATLAGVLLLAGLASTNEAFRGYLAFSWGRLRGGYTLAERLEQFGAPVAARVRPDFEKAGLRYPPVELAYLAFKDTRILDVYGRDTPAQAWRFVRRYPILGTSGTLGPKLVEGDKQVPEGVYHAEYLHPHSRFHLSIRLNYPNAFDRRMAQADRRSRLGGDIMIHGSAVSIGCLAMGDQAAEDLFVLAALANRERVQILVSPKDFRRNAAAVPIQGPDWVPDLYAGLASALQAFPRAPDR